MDSDEVLLFSKLEVRNWCLSLEVQRLSVGICFYPTQTKDGKKERSGVG